MTRWRATASLARALTVGGVGIGIALVLGRPAVVVLVAPIVVAGAAAILAKPATEPQVSAHASYAVLHEGQGTASRLRVAPDDDVEFVTRVCASAAYIALRPAGGCLGHLADRPVPLLISPRRWGQRRIGEEKVGLFSPWAGYRWGPVGLVGREVSVLPTSATFRSAAAAPNPIGLIGAHRSRRDGDGTEFSSIREFHAGDRMRRINWRVSLRSSRLYVVSTRSEEDTALLLVVDALADYGISGGIDAAPSSLDVAMRAAGAIAEQYVRQGDRVSLRVVSPHGEYVGYGAGSRHLRRILGQLSRVRPGVPHEVTVDQIDFRTAAGSMVVVLSPMLSEGMATAAVRLLRRGLPVIVVDTLPDDAAATVSSETDPEIGELAWRMRLVERSQVLDSLAAAGCPVVPWNGPRTLDVIVRRLARRARLPRAGVGAR
jgi:uncharacterized protein (DUF58 family)